MRASESEPKSKHRTPAAAAVSLFALALALVLALALGPGGASGPSQSDPLLAGTWHLASGSDHGSGLQIGGHAITLTVGDAAHTGGTEPCSRYRATVTGGIGAVFIRAHSVTAITDTCSTSDSSQLARRYLQSLEASRFAAIRDGTLVLSSSNSTLVFLRSAPAPVADIRNTNWRLYAVGTQVFGFGSDVGVAPVSLTFNGSNGITLSSPCVTATADYQLEGENMATTHTISSPIIGTGCTTSDRIFAAGAIFVFAGSLLIDESTDSADSPAMLVVTNLDDNLPIVFRAEN